MDAWKKFIKKIKKSPNSGFYNKKALTAALIFVAVSGLCVAIISLNLSGGDLINAPAVDQEWPQLLLKYKDDPNTNQLLFIKCIEKSSNAEAYYFVKSDDGTRWDMAGDGPAYIGTKGLGKKIEGDRKTPEGDFTVTGAFGIKPNPGTPFKYTHIGPYTVACDEDCKYYNQIVDVRNTGNVRGEMMIEHTPAYNYGMILDFNPENRYPLGSNIFLHCMSSSRSTAGCVAIEETLMLRILTTATPGFKICIHTK